jgi:diaphanous 1
MHQLSPDRKKYLMRQNSQTRSATLSRASAKSASPISPSNTGSYGPAAAAAMLPRLVPQLTGEGGFMKRFSMAGWSANPPAQPAQADPPTSPEPKAEKFGTKRGSRDLAAESKPLQSQGTGGLWNSWWASSGGDKSSEKAQTAKWYVDGVRNAKAMDTKLVKHLITLRVHLSTAQLVWIEEFVKDEGGIEALGAILSGLVGKGGKRKQLTEHEEMILLEVIKCLRVLLNTEVRRCSSLNEVVTETPLRRDSTGCCLPPR